MVLHALIHQLELRIDKGCRHAGFVIHVVCVDVWCRPFVGAVVKERKKEEEKRVWSRCSW